MIKHFFGIYGLVFSGLLSYGFDLPWFYRVVEVSDSLNDSVLVGAEWEPEIAVFEGGETNLWADGFYAYEFRTSGNASLYPDKLNKVPFALECSDWSESGGVFYKFGESDTWLSLVRVWKGSISGVVTLDGAPVTNAMVRVWADRGRWLESVGSVEPVVTGPDGSYCVNELASGSYRLAVSWVSGSSSMECAFSNAVAVTAGPVTGVNIQLVWPCAFSGRVVGSRYCPPASDIRVRLFKRSLDYTFHMEWTYGLWGYGPWTEWRWDWLSVVTRDGAYWQSVEGPDPLYTDSVGGFSFPSLAPGNYCLSFSDSSGFYKDKDVYVRLPLDDKLIYLEPVSYDWTKNIPVGVTWILGVDIVGQDVAVTVSNLDPRNVYRLLANSSLGVKGWKIVSVASYVSGEYVFHVPFNEYGASFFKVQSFRNVE